MTVERDEPHRFLGEGSSSDPFPDRINVVNRAPVNEGPSARDTGAVGLEGPEFGRVFGKVMQQYPKADIRLVNAVLRIVAAEYALSGGAVGEREKP